MNSSLGRKTSWESFNNIKSSDCGWQRSVCDSNIIWETSWQDSTKLEMQFFKGSVVNFQIIIIIIIIINILFFYLEGKYLQLSLLLYDS